MREDERRGEREVRIELRNERGERGVHERGKRGEKRERGEVREERRRGEEKMRGVSSYFLYYCYSRLEA